MWYTSSLRLYLTDQFPNWHEEMQLQLLEVDIWGFGVDPWTSWVLVEKNPNHGIHDLLVEKLSLNKTVLLHTFCTLPDINQLITTAFETINSSF